MRLFHSLSIAASLAAVITMESANAQTPAPAQPRPAPMVLTISGWPDGAQIPAKFTQAGEQVSPKLDWTNVPAGTLSFVVNMLDPDVAIQRGTETQPHWIVWNIPGTATGLAGSHEGGRRLARRHAPDQRIRSSVSRTRRRGEWSAASLHVRGLRARCREARRHRVDQRTAGPAALETRAAVMKAMQGHVLGKAVYVGLFKRPQ